MVFGEYLSGPHRPDVASVRRILLRNQVFKHRRCLIDQEYIHTPNKKEILVTTRSVKFNCCVYFGSGVLSRNSAGNKLFLGTTEVLKVSLTVLFTCAQQKASGHCYAQGCFHHSEVHTDAPRRNYIKSMDLRDICRSTCFSATLEPMPSFLTYAL